MKTPKNKLSGIWTALVTPFMNGQIDHSSLQTLVQHQLAQGVDGFVIGGTTGESPTISLAELETVYAKVRAITGSDFPILLGTGSNSTAKTIETTKKVAEWGALGALVVVPYYNKPPQRGLIAHFEAVAESSQLPIVLYNVPGRTITRLTVDTVLKLSQHPQIIGVKDATGEMQDLKEMLGKVPAEFSLLSGDDGTAMEYCRLGGHGAIAVASHVIGKAMKQSLNRIYEHPSEATGAVRDFQTLYGSLIESLYLESNPIPVKAALKMMGVIASAELRLPLVELESKSQVKVEQCLKAVGLV